MPQVTARLSEEGPPKPKPPGQAAPDAGWQSHRTQETARRPAPWAWSPWPRLSRLHLGPVRLERARFHLEKEPLRIVLKRKKTVQVCSIATGARSLAARFREAEALGWGGLFEGGMSTVGVGKRSQQLSPQGVQGVVDEEGEGLSRVGEGRGKKKKGFISQPRAAGLRGCEAVSGLLLHGRGQHETAGD